MDTRQFHPHPARPRARMAYSGWTYGDSLWVNSVKQVQLVHMLKKQLFLVNSLENMIIGSTGCRTFYSFSC